MSSDRRQLSPRVILVADRTLAGDYSILFEGIFASMQTTKVPRFAWKHLLSKPVPVSPDGRASQAPIGVRRVEASLLAETDLTEEDVVVATPESLPGLLSSRTEAVLFSSSDPLGRGMSNTTTSAFWSGRLYTEVLTEETLLMLKGAKQTFGFKVIVGGAGAWQFTGDRDEARRLGVDTIFEGYFENQGPQLIEDILAGKPVADHIAEKGTAIERLRPIRGGAMLGVLELSRGCGYGCEFCTMSDRPMQHVPADVVLSDLEANYRAGSRSVVNSSEDFFRYGATGAKVNFEALRDLLTRMREVGQLRFMQIDHANVTSVLQYSKEQLAEIRRLLTWSARTDYLWVNLGVESASGRLVKSIGPGKLGRLDPDCWAEAVTEAGWKLTETGFFPVFSLVLGLEGETPADVAATQTLVDEFDRMGAVVFPVFHEPYRQDRRHARFDLSRMREDHLDLYERCYEMNFRRAPKLYYDNQRAGGVAWFKRNLIQTLGKTEVAGWRRNFRRERRRIRRTTQQCCDRAAVALAAEAERNSHG
ncbi:MAG: B12-binding domain-containing radical SAM protein [Phycisphaerae bacterium]